MIQIETEYRQVKITIESKLAEAFKVACIASNESMTGVLVAHMAKYSKATQEKKAKSSLSTKRQRRATIEKIVQKLEQVKKCEEEYKERIPENLQTSSVYEVAEQWIEILDEAIELLDSMP